MAKTVLFILVVLVLAIGLSWVFDLNFWIAFIIAAVAILVNGWIASWEDEQPGGFNNPKPPDPK